MMDKSTRMANLVAMELQSNKMVTLLRGPGIVDSYMELSFKLFQSA